MSQLVPGPTMVFCLSPQCSFLSTGVDPSLPLAEQTRTVLLQSLKVSPRHAEILIYRWLLHADTLLFMNAPFDLGMMRARSALWRSVLDGRHQVVDLSYVNFLESEVRPEKSLKTIGPILGTHKYEESKTRFQTRAGRFSNLPSLLHYMGQDTVNTMSAIAELARRITGLGETEKLSAFSVQFYSDVIQGCVEMTENGVPFNRTAMEEFAHHLIADTELAFEFAKREGLQLSNKEDEGSQKSKDAFMQTLLAAVEEIHFNPLGVMRSGMDLGYPIHAVSAIDHPMIELTEKQRKLSFNDANRTLLASFLPPSHPLHPLLRVIEHHSHAEKLLSSYCYPLLWHKRKGKKIDRTSLLCPQPGVPAPCSSSSLTPEVSLGTSTPTASPVGEKMSEALSLSFSLIPPPPLLSLQQRLQSLKGFSRNGSLNENIWLSHPSWFIVPSSVKDGSGASGGTLQSRITCKKGSHQTDPPEIQDFWESRWHGGSIVSIDLSQIELRAAALLSGEPFFVNAYLNEWDLHARATLMIWGEAEIVSRYSNLRGVSVDKWRKTNENFKKMEAQVGKRTNFAHLFRAGAEKMQESVLGDIGEMLPLRLFQRIVDNRPTELPLLWEWQEARIHEARTTGRILLPYIGQSRSFLGGDKYDVNEIVNFPVQTTASNTLLRIAAALFKALRRLHCRTILPFLNVYDALKFDCKTPADVETLRTLWQEALDFVVTKEYWHWLQELHGRVVPIKYEIEVHTL